MKKICQLIISSIFIFLWMFAAPAMGAKLVFIKQEKNITSYRTADGRILEARKLGGNISDVPNYDWWYGCTPTSTGMMLGYYDRNGYQCHSFDNFVHGGTAELSSFGNPSAIANNAIASSGHIDDFYTGYDNYGDDPLDSGRTLPDDFDCIADFMGTSQDSCGNSDGSTTLYFYQNGTVFSPADAVANNVQDESGVYGIYEYLVYAGYSYVTNSLYNQYISGFTFDDYKNEIDNGRPVLIHVEGHTMLGFGYLDPDTVYLHDTWADVNNTMTWGGSYSSMDHYGVTCLELAGGIEVFDFGDVPDPAYPTLLANNGARHRVCSSIYLGSVVDDETDGQPNVDASGDDTDGTDDEDGVIFQTKLNIGSIIGVDVTASATGFLDAWIDFNADGDWADVGEQIFSSEALTSGVNSLAFTVPVSSTVGTTFARFRFSSVGGLSYSGYAEDGEVEDYEVEIIYADYTVTFIAGSDGSIEGATIQYVYDGDDCASVMAVPDTGYFFDGWTGDYIGTDNPLTITNVTFDMTITANFLPLNRVAFTAGYGGRITGEAIQYVYDGDDCTPVTAAPYSGYEFTGWTGDYIGSDNPLTVTSVASDMDIRANFTAIPPIDDSGGGGGGGGCFINSLQDY